MFCSIWLQAQVSFQTPRAVQEFWQDRLDINYDDNEVSTELNALSFMRNTEFFNTREEGATRFGMMLRGIQTAQSGLSSKLEVGALVIQHYGGETFLVPHVAMVHWLPMGPSPWHLRLGSLARPDHGLKLPLYNPDLLYTRAMEYGLQLRGPWLDLWWAWDQAIDYGSPHKEAFTAGLVMNPTVVRRGHLTIGLDAQLLYHHIGGQIDESPAGQEGNLVESYVGPYLNCQLGERSNIHAEAGVLRAYDAFNQWNVFQWSTGFWSAVQYHKVIDDKLSLKSELSFADLSQFQSRKGQLYYQRDRIFLGCIIMPIVITQLQTRVNWTREGQIWSVGVSQFKEQYKPGIQWAVDFNVMLPINFTRRSSAD